MKLTWKKMGNTSYASNSCGLIVVKVEPKPNGLVMVEAYCDAPLIVGMKFGDSRYFISEALAIAWVENSFK